MTAGSDLNELKAQAAPRPERRRADLGEPEARLQKIIETSLDGIITMDEAGVITGWNPRAVEMFGWTAAEAVGRTVADTIVPAELRKRHQEGIARYLESGSGPVLGKVVDHLHALHRDGHVFPVELAISRAWQDDHRVTFIAFVRDISRRRRIESLREMGFAVTRALGTSSSWDAAAPQLLKIICTSLGWSLGEFWVVDFEHRLIRRERGWHPPGQDLDWFETESQGLALRPGVGNVGRVWIANEPASIAEVASDDNFARGSAAAASGLTSAVAFPVRSGGTVVAVLEFFAGRPIELDDELTLVMTELGELAGLFYDRLEARRRHAEAEAALRETLNQLQGRARALERSNAELEQFAYVASHDLSEPLRMISSYLQLLASRYQGKLDADADDFINFAVGGANRMQALINDLLAYSRVGRVEQSHRPVDFGALVEQTLAAFTVRVEELGAVIQVDELPSVVGEPAQFRQLFQNLISNSLKFVDQQPTAVHIWADRDHAGWRFSIQDNGIPIQPQHADRIFNMFQRLHARDEFEGTGVGLAICKKVVERHGGSIWVEPAPGGGNIFRFTIPDSTERPVAAPGEIERKMRTRP